MDFIILSNIVLKITSGPSMVILIKQAKFKSDSQFHNLVFKRHLTKGSFWWIDTTGVEIDLFKYI